MLKSSGGSFSGFGAGPLGAAGSAWALPACAFGGCCGDTGVVVDLAASFSAAEDDCEGWAGPSVPAGDVARGGGFDRIAIMASAEGFRSGAGAPAAGGCMPERVSLRGPPGSDARPPRRSRPGVVELTRSRACADDAAAGSAAGCAFGGMERRGTSESSFSHEEQAAAPIGFHSSHCPQTMPISVRSASKPLPRDPRRMSRVEWLARMVAFEPQIRQAHALFVDRLGRHRWDHQPGVVTGGTRSGGPSRRSRPCPRAGTEPCRCRCWPAPFRSRASPTSRCGCR